MKIRILFVLIIFSSIPAFVSAQSTKEISYEDVTLKIPEDWFHRTNQFQNGGSLNIGKEGEKNSITINFWEAKIPSEEILNFNKANFSKLDLFKNAKYSETSEVTFNGFQAKRLEFSTNFQNQSFVGKMIAFNRNSRSYLVMYNAIPQFSNSSTLQDILASIKISH